MQCYTINANAYTPTHAILTAFQAIHFSILRSTAKPFFFASFLSFNLLHIYAITLTVSAQRIVVIHFVVSSSFHFDVVAFELKIKCEIVPFTPFSTLVLRVNTKSLLFCSPPETNYINYGKQIDLFYARCAWNIDKTEAKTNGNANDFSTNWKLIVWIHWMQ